MSAMASAASKCPCNGYALPPDANGEVKKK